MKVADVIEYEGKAAIVCKVHGDGSVNLIVFDENGDSKPVRGNFHGRPAWYVEPPAAQAQKPAAVLSSAGTGYNPPSPGVKK